MIRVLLAVDIDDFGFGPQGTKEAAAMALEKLSRVQVLQVKVLEEKQVKIWEE